MVVVKTWGLHEITINSFKDSSLMLLQLRNEEIFSIQGLEKEDHLWRVFFYCSSGWWISMYKKSHLLLLSGSFCQRFFSIDIG